MGSITEGKITRFVESIYESSTSGSPEGWPRVFDEFSLLVSSGPGSLAIHSASDDRFNVVASSIDPTFLKAYFEHYQFVSPFRNAIVNLKVGEIFSRREFLADDVYLKSSYYNEFAGQQDVFQLEHHSLYSDQGITGSLSLSRPKHRPEFSRDERRLIDHGVIHLRRAFGNYIDLLNLRAQNNMLSGVLESAGCAVFVIDSKMRIAYANQIAELLLKKKDLLKQKRTGEIAFRSSRAMRIVEAAASMVDSIGSSDTLIPEGVVIGKTAGGERVTLKIAYCGGLPLDGMRSGRRLILYVHGLLEPTSSIDKFASSHGLTIAEINVLELLVAGNDVKTICLKLDISINTARTHLKRLFAKTGKRRQADLIRYFLS